MPDAAALRSQFPVLETLAYLNTGSVGPLPKRAAEAVEAEIAHEVANGRADFERAGELAQHLRVRISELLNAATDEVALTGATTDGVNAVIAGLELGRGDEVVTSDVEHPGVLVPLAIARARRGVDVKTVPFEEVADAVGPATRLVVQSHVSWHDGRIADTAALAACDAPVLLDGAQGLGAVPVDVEELGCEFYAASGQKWLCGPIGTGYLHVRRDWLDYLAPAWPGPWTVADPAQALDSPLRKGAGRFDTRFPAALASGAAIAALDVLEAPGLAAVHERAARLAAHFAAAMRERGGEVAPRGPSTLVSWTAPDPKAEVARLRSHGFVLRDLPGTPWVRASVGAWSTEEELDRLAATATSGS